MASAESSLCLLLARHVNAASKLGKTAFPLGQAMDRVLKLLVRLYTSGGVPHQTLYPEDKASLW